MSSVHRAPESLWINREVELFRQLGRQNRILALLIEGTPAESFPQALRTIRRTIAPGMDRDQVQEIEPLAADVRASEGGNPRRLKRMARLRLMACILGVRFDELRMRERDRNRLRLCAFAAAAAVLLGVLSILSYRTWRSDANASLQRQLADSAQAESAAAQAQSVAAQEQRLQADKRRAAADQLRAAAEQLANDQQHKRNDADAAAAKEKARADEVQRLAQGETQQARSLVDQLNAVESARQKALASREAYVAESFAAKKAGSDTEAAELWSAVQSQATQAQAKYDAQDYAGAQIQWEQSSKRAQGIETILAHIHTARKDYEDALAKLDAARLTTYGGDDWKRVLAAVDRASAAGDDEATALKEYATAQQLLLPAWKTASGGFTKASAPIIARQVADHLNKARALEKKSEFRPAYNEVLLALALNNTDSAALDVKKELLSKDNEGEIILSTVVPAVNFDRIPFSDVLESIRTATGARIFVNWIALKNAGIAKDSPVSAKLKDVQLATLIAMITQSVSTQSTALSFEFDDGAIVIDTLKNLDAKVVLQSYDVANLAKTSADVNALVKLIESTIDTKSWRANGGTAGSIRIVGHNILVEHCKRVQKLVAATLKSLQTAK